MTYEAPPEVLRLKIEFTRHVVHRKTTRADWLVQTNSYRETREKLPELERILREKGRWYRKFDTEEGLMKYYCIVSNLEVYCGILMEEKGIILVKTYWPYTSKMKRRIFPRGVENYERFILDEEE
jgi:hypothetical protein